eukprot:COSAG06_NODE_24141_length_671_cov_1.349650_1_plen_154_part_00
MKSTSPFPRLPARPPAGKQRNWRERSGRQLLELAVHERVSQPFWPQPYTTGLTGWLPWWLTRLMSCRGCITWRVLGVGKEAAAGRHWKWQSFLRPTLLVEAEFQILLVLWLASCPQAVITILGFLMLMTPVRIPPPPPPPPSPSPPNPLTLAN